MKKFDYKLMKVLKVRRLQENICRGEMTKIQQSINDKEQEIQSHLEAIETGRTNLSSSAGFSPIHYRQFVQYEEALRQKNGELGEAIQQEQEALEEKKEELKKHSLETKKLEKDEEKKFRSWQQDFKSEEQKVFDDIASRKNR